MRTHRTTRGQRLLYRYWSRINWRVSAKTVLRSLAAAQILFIARFVHASFRLEMVEMGRLQIRSLKHVYDVRSRQHRKALFALVIIGRISRMVATGPRRPLTPNRFAATAMADPKVQQPFISWSRGRSSSLRTGFNGPMEQFASRL